MTDDGVQLTAGFAADGVDVKMIRAKRSSPPPRRMGAIDKRQCVFKNEIIVFGTSLNSASVLVERDLLDVLQGHIYRAGDPGTLGIHAAVCSHPELTSPGERIEYSLPVPVYIIILLELWALYNQMFVTLAAFSCCHCGWGGGFLRLISGLRPRPATT